MADHTGQQLGNYRLISLIGTGGFAEVYLGEHVHLGSQAAIKLLHTHLATPGEGEKFRREAQTLVTLQHPNIVRVLDFGVEAGTPFLVMDYAPNGSLRQRFPGETPLPAATILPYVLQVAGALQYAHEHQFIHHDVKPENMLLGRRQEVLLTDFGIATVAQSTSQQRTQGVAGTAAYMAPEQLQGKPRPASDLYALGVVAYEWLCGERPFQGGPLEVISQHVLTPPPPLREKVPGIPAAIEQVVLTALAKDPRERFGSVRAFANAFQQACGKAGTAYVLSDQPITPFAPASPPPLLRGQGGILVSDAAAQPGTTPTGQVDQAGASLFSATTQITPQLTPPVSMPPVPTGQISQAGPSLYSAETHLISLTPAPAQAGTAVPSTVLSSTSRIDGGAITGDAQGVAMSPKPGVQGWAAQTPQTGPNTPMLATAEAASGAGGQAAQSDEHTLADAPVVPGAPAPERGRRHCTGGWSRWALVTAACLVVLALIGGGTAYGLPLLLHASSSPPTSQTAAPVATGATVTITPTSSDVKNTFNLTGVTGTPDASKRQVGARVISVTTPSYSKTVSATGTGTTPGTQATGTVTVTNFDAANPLTLAVGSTYPNNIGCASYSGLSVVLDAPVSLQPATPGAPTGVFIAIPAHILQVGAIGNIPTICPGNGNGFYYVSGTCPASIHQSKFCFNMANQGAFTGGTDPQTYTAVAQSDINNAANSLIHANQPNAQQIVQGQLQSGEQLVGTQQCSPNTSANHKVGDAASQVTVSASFTCTGEAYDHDGALVLAKQLLTDQATSTLGTGYSLVGQIKTTLVSATPDDQGGVQIAVQAEGVWAYQFSDAQKQTLASLIAGKSKQDAQALLSTQTGVAQVSIQIAGGNGQTLPADPSQISIVIQAVSGL